MYTRNIKKEAEESKSCIEDFLFDVSHLFEIICENLHIESEDFRLCSLIQ